MKRSPSSTWFHIRKRTDLNHGSTGLVWPARGKLRVTVWGNSHAERDHRRVGLPDTLALLHGQGPRRGRQAGERVRDIPLGAGVDGPSNGSDNAPCSAGAAEPAGAAFASVAVKAARAPEDAVYIGRRAPNPYPRRRAVKSVCTWRVRFIIVPGWLQAEIAWRSDAPSSNAHSLRSRRCLLVGFRDLGLG